MEALSQISSHTRYARRLQASAAPRQELFGDGAHRSPSTSAARRALEKGLRSKDAFVLRRCQILLSSARGERARRIAAYLGIDDQTVLDALHAFNAVGRPACSRSPRAPTARAWCLVRSKPSACARSCTAAHATSATPLWPPHECVDAGPGRRGQRGRGHRLHPREGGDDPPDAAAPGRWLEAGQTLDHQPRSCIRPKKGGVTA